tara:strand:- start:451 stop:1482 length:1032 start_codon:yes stop_codon:yes gene_type:complete
MPLSKIKTNSVADEVFEAGSNLIINGAMQVAVRGTSAVAAAANYPSIDRFKAWESSDGAYTVEQSTTAPAGFTTSLKAQVTTADTSLAANQYAQLSQQIEAQNLQSLVYGTNDAKTVTLSFYVRSNKTGSYSITIYKDDATSYLFSKSYTIDSADTWERKSITITPDSNIKASGGAIANDNGIGFYVFWNLAGGTDFDDATDNAWSSNTSHFHTSSQVNWMDNTSNNFYLTGVQLEIGEQATPFEHRSFGDELAKCQRYFLSTVASHQQYQSDAGNIPNGSLCSFPCEMRASPTISFTSTMNATRTNSSSAVYVTASSFYFGVNVTSTGTHNRQVTLTADAEL